MLDREESGVGRQGRLSPSALVVVDDAVMERKRREIGCHRVVVHARSAVDHDDRRAFAALAVPEANAVACMEEFLSGQRSGDREYEEQQQRTHRNSIWIVKGEE